jgi:hypothetical protein
VYICDGLWSAVRAIDLITLVWLLLLIAMRAQSEAEVAIEQGETGLRE